MVSFVYFQELKIVNFQEETQHALSRQHLLKAGQGICDLCILAINFSRRASFRLGHVARRKLCYKGMYGLFNQIKCFLANGL